MHAIEKLREFERSSTIKHGILRFNMSSQRLLMFNWAQLSEGINRVCYNVNADALGGSLMGAKTCVVEVCNTKKV